MISNAGVGLARVSVSVTGEKESLRSQSEPPSTVTEKVANHTFGSKNTSGFVQEMRWVAVGVGGE
ncbi:MAG TPA: hypothetical protein VFJ85_09785 [Acidimicrobiales bacterium]|nr:hypothetical protein [Acidimicrobiales bacterium]